MPEEFEVIDAEAMGITVEYLTPAQIRKLKEWYQNMTGDMDLERIDFFCK